MTNPVVSLQNGKPMTSSLDVAELFGRLHKNVLRGIENLECSEEFNRLNFEPVDYRDAKGERRQSYNMTKDSFTFLVMGYTGPKAPSSNSPTLSLSPIPAAALKIGGAGLDAYGRHQKMTALGPQRG